MTSGPVDLLTVTEIININIPAVLKGTLLNHLLLWPSQSVPVAQRDIPWEWIDIVLSLFMHLEPLLMHTIVQTMPGETVFFSFQFSCFTTCIVFNCSWESVTALPGEISRIPIFLSFELRLVNGWGIKGKDNVSGVVLAASCNPAKSEPSFNGFLLNNNEGTESTIKTESAGPFWILINWDTFYTTGCMHKSALHVELSCTANQTSCSDLQWCRSWGK